jgi:hypothetical protein
LNRIKRKKFLQKNLKIGDEVHATIVCFNNFHRFPISPRSNSSVVAEPFRRISSGICFGKLNLLIQTKLFNQIPQPTLLK